jgi:hypothetical protein
MRGIDFFPSTTIVANTTSSFSSLYIHHYRLYFFLLNTTYTVLFKFGEDYFSKENIMLSKQTVVQR